MGALSLVVLDVATDTPILNNVDNSQLNDYLYFSYVTLTTLGYGDLTPTNSGGRVVAMLLSTGGQLYIAILIAMLVGKFLSNSKTNIS
jgi:voltage-gated potassium channel Kch